MPYEAIVETLQPLTLTSTDVLLDNVKLMLQFGYQGTVTFGTGGNARIDMTAAGAVPISASIGDTILYRTDPAAEVVKCVTAEELAANYRVV